MQFVEHFFMAIFAIPIVAIVLGIGSEIIKTTLKSKERQLELRLQAKNGGNENLTREIQALRAELAQQREDLARLQDTATSYDLSIDNQIQHLERRLRFMENARIEAPAAAQEETVQRLGQIR
jgi:hypothetical protein